MGLRLLTLHNLNHLIDLVDRAREAIESFLTETPATMLVVSHDRRFLDTVCERLWVVDDGAVAPFDGGYRAWRTAVADGWTVEAELKRQANRLQPATLPAGSEALSRRSSRGSRRRLRAPRERHRPRRSRAERGSSRSSGSRP